ncbi:MAG TPA: patatin-like phospholipase family protein [Thermoleophilaceae bacterium]
MRVDIGILLNAREALLPLPLVDGSPRAPAGVLPPPQPRERPDLAGRHVVGSHGGGGSVAMIGLAHAFEEAGERPESISVCSASVLWGAMWAAGTSAEEMAGHALLWRPQDHLGVQWTGLPRLALASARGFGGLGRGRAVEQLFDRRVWRMSAGATEIPFRTLAYDLDAGRFELLGSDTHPDLTLGELARVAVAPPRRADAVRLEGRFYVDGRGAPGFTRELLEPDGPTLDAGDAPPSFYGLFLDRRRWPDHIRSGYG